MASTLDIYNAHFGFDERPFTLVPNPTFLFWSKAHRRAATVLEFGILTQAPITVLTGEVGLRQDNPAPPLAADDRFRCHRRTGVECLR